MTTRRPRQPTPPAIGAGVRVDIYASPGHSTARLVVPEGVAPAVLRGAPPGPWIYLATDELERMVSPLGAELILHNLGVHGFHIWGGSGSIAR